MSAIEVRIVNLPPMTVASTYGFGPGPEPIAWDKMNTFVEQSGLGTDGQAHRYFGFNNPSPAPGSPNYGYEQWVTVAPETPAAGEAKIKQFGGGLYAVTRCRLVNITQTWQNLVAWRESSPYRHSSHQWLEECLNPALGQPVDENTLEFDIYLPIAQ